VLPCQNEEHPILIDTLSDPGPSSREQRFATQQRTKLLRTVIATCKSRQGLQTSSITPGQDDAPAMLVKVCDGLIGHTHG
jgi:hypothetical protein